MEAGTHNRVVVSPVETEEKISGGIYIPDIARERPSKGIVLSVSEQDDMGRPPYVRIGDTVMYSKHAGTQVQHENKNVLIMRETDIFAIL